MAAILLVGVRIASAEVVASTARLNLRQCPSTTNCSVVRTMHPATQMEILQKNGVWYQVRVVATGERGWVHSAYTRPIQTANAGQSSEEDAEGASGVIKKLVSQFAPFLLIGGALFILGYSGRLVRQGVMRRRALVNAMEQLSKEGKTVNEKWHSYMRGAKFRIGGPIVFWLGVYAFLYHYLSPWDFALSLLGLLLPIMGYLGFFLVPGLGGTFPSDD